MVTELAIERDTKALTKTTTPIVIALVCSAGGLHALREVLGGLPIDFNAAIIVLQHLQPDRPSHLPKLLQKFSKLPVESARNNERLRTGRVIVAPPGQHALVTTDNRVALVASDGVPPYRPSADLLLTSLAIVAGRRTIAVILSGLGHDGATGASALHRFGGTVIASDEATSEHFAMPAAAIARDDAVDYIVPLSEIAQLLVGLVNERRDEAAVTA